MKVGAEVEGSSGATPKGKNRFIGECRGVREPIAPATPAVKPLSRRNDDSERVEANP